MHFCTQQHITCNKILSGQIGKRGLHVCSFMKAVYLNGGGKVSTVNLWYPQGVLFQDHLWVPNSMEPQRTSRMRPKVAITNQSDFWSCPGGPLRFPCCSLVICKSLKGPLYCNSYCCKQDLNLLASIPAVVVEIAGTFLLLLWLLRPPLLTQHSQLESPHWEERRNMRSGVELRGHTKTPPPVRWRPACCPRSRSTCCGYSEIW